MLTSSQAICSYDYRRRIVVPDRLCRGTHDHYLRPAQRLLNLYRHGAGRIRQELHQRVESILESTGDCPPRRIAAFCKLLDDAGVFHHDARAARKLRTAFFTLGASLHPIVIQQESVFETRLGDARRRAEQTLGMTWEEIENKLFSDVIEMQRLKQFELQLDASSLLSLYNLAQAQATLYRATHIRVIARRDFKTILRHAKLARLMHSIERHEDHDGVYYQFDFDGAASTLRETWRYGVRFAAMLAKLVACRDWTLQAYIHGPKSQRFLFELSAADRLRSPLAPPDDYDSTLEQQIEGAWRANPVEGWTLERESELLHVNQSVLTPDFVLVRAVDRRKFFVEVVGFWTPEYFQEKSRRLRLWTQPTPQNPDPLRFILIVPETSLKRHSLAELGLQLPVLPVGKTLDPHAMIRLAMTIP